MAAAVTTGTYRFAIYDSKNNRRNFSEGYDASILDNVATPRVVYNSPGTANDQPVFWDAWVSGPAQELLVLEYLATAAVSFDTSTTLAILFKVRSKYRDSSRAIVTRTLDLALADRITRTTAGTRQDPNGIDDDPVSVANNYSKILAFKPQPNENWQVFSYQLFSGQTV